MTAAGRAVPRRHRQRREAAVARRSELRESRWRERRYAVPYRTDGPKITLGVLWFGAVVGSLLVSPWVTLFVVAVVAGIAGLQTGHAWSHHTFSDRRVTAALAVATTAGAGFGTFGLGLTCVLATVGAVGFAVISSAAAAEGTGPVHRDAVIRLAEVTVRSAVPAGLAAGSLVALGWLEVAAAISLVLLVSAYETGDFLVGTGSANAVEGPIAGIATLAVVGFGLYLAQPEPLTQTSAVLFAALTAVCCPLGQIAGSAILPRGDAWAPALRRLDSYLVAGPLWLVLI